MSESPCEKLGIPTRLEWNAQPVIDKFEDEKEKLYRWFNPDTEYTYEGHLSATTIKNVFSPPFDISCNRSSLCKYSTDVLYNTSKLPHRYDFGVIETLVKDVKGYKFDFLQTQQNGETHQVSIELEIEHIPEECMYPHSEIIVYKDGERIKDKVKPSSLKTVIRDKLARVFTVCHKPNPNFKLEEVS